MMCRSGEREGDTEMPHTIRKQATADEQMAQRIRQDREDLGLTREESAYVLGCEASAIYYWETAQYAPSEDAIRAMACLFGWAYEFKDSATQETTDKRYAEVLERRRPRRSKGRYRGFRSPWAVPHLPSGVAA